MQIFGSFLPKTHKCKSCRSRQERSKEYSVFICKIGVDTAENEPLNVRLIFKLWESLFTSRRPAQAAASPAKAAPKPARRRRVTRLRFAESGRQASESSELDRARPRLYRSQILQVNMRLKALAEIYTMHSFALL